MRRFQKLARGAAALIAILQCGWAAGAMAAAPADGGAHAQSAQKITLDIVSQPLGKALNEWASQTGYQVLLSSKEAAGNRMAPALSGSFTPEAALQRLLVNSGLKYEFVAARTVTILSAASTPASTFSGDKPAGSGDQLSLKLAQALGTAAAGRAGESQTEENSQDSSSAQKSRAGRIDEVIVTATKRAENVQDVPVSMSVISSDDIDKKGLVNAADYLRGIPGVNQVEGGISQAIVIRGLETNTEFQNYLGGSTTATYFGETSTTGSAGLLGSNIDIKLVDIERVEVLRGPQGTAFGSSAMGGAVRTIPVAPKLDRYEAKVGASYSATSGTGGNNYMVQGVGNIPLMNDKLAIRATAYAFSDSGFYRNRGASDPAFLASIVTPYNVDPSFVIQEDEVGANNVKGGRIAALFKPTDSVRVTLNYLKQKAQTDGWALSNSGTYEQNVLAVAPEHLRRGEKGGFSDYDIDIANAVVELDLGWADLLGTYSRVKGGFAESYAYSLYLTPWPAGTMVDIGHEEKVGEVRLATKFDGPVNALVGAYIEDSTDAYDILGIVWYGDPATNFFSPGARNLGTYSDRRKLEQTSIFGEVSWAFLDRFKLTGGARTSNYERTVGTVSQGIIYGGGATQLDKADDDATIFRANLSFKPGESSLLYAGWAQGFRLGKPQPIAPTGLCDTDGNGLFDGTNVPISASAKVKADSVDSYEIGGKLTALDRRLVVDGAIFRMDWNEIPVSVRQPCNWLYLANVGAALSEGAEMQLRYYPTEAWSLELGGSYIKARLTEDVPVQGFVAGDRLPGSPKVNGNVGVQYSFFVGGYTASVRTDAVYVGEFFGDLKETPNLKAGDYVKLDASARLTIKDLNIDLFIRNITNEDAFVFRGYSGLNDAYGYRPRPRTVGVQLGYSF